MRKLTACALGAFAIAIAIACSCCVAAPAVVVCPPGSPSATSALKIAMNVASESESGIGRVMRLLLRVVCRHCVSDGGGGVLTSDSAMPEVVRARERLADVELCDLARERPQRLEAVDEHVHVPVAPLEASVREQQRLAAHERAVALVHRRRDDQVHLAVLVQIGRAHV